MVVLRIITFFAVLLVAKSEKILYNSARGLLNRGRRTKRESLATHPGHIVVKKKSERS